MPQRHTALAALMTAALTTWATATAFLQQDGEVATTVADGFTIATVGDLILTRLQALSAPYGTTIRIENGIGVIRP